MYLGHDWQYICGYIRSNGVQLFEPFVYYTQTFRPDQCNVGLGVSELDKCLENQVNERLLASLKADMATERWRFQSDPSALTRFPPKKLRISYSATSF